jgi:ribosome maturation factor RimP
MVNPSLIARSEALHLTHRRAISRLNHSPLSYGGWPWRAASFCFGRSSLDGNEATTSTSATTLSLEGKLAAIIAPRLAAMGFELVRVAVLGRERPTVQIMADRADGSQISVDDCTQISHDVSAALDVEDPIPGAWTLEVSSAGIDRPLTRIKDWNRFAGHQARVETFIPLNGRKRFVGVVLGADEDTARLRLDGGMEVVIRHPDIRRAKLVLTDALIEATAAAPRPN